jgi:hypothetical protein
MEKTMLTLFRKKAKTMIDYDLNIFMQEIQDPMTDEWYYDPTSWHVHVYKVDGAGHQEVADARPMTPEEIRALGLNNDPYFDGGDAWYGMYGYLQDYASIMPNTIKDYLESFPVYEAS